MKEQFINFVYYKNLVIYYQKYIMFGEISHIKKQ